MWWEFFSSPEKQTFLASMLENSVTAEPESCLATYFWLFPLKTRTFRSHAGNCSGKSSSSNDCGTLQDTHRDPSRSSVARGCARWNCSTHVRRFNAVFILFVAKLWIFIIVAGESSLLCFREPTRKFFSIRKHEFLTRNWRRQQQLRWKEEGIKIN